MHTRNLGWMNVLLIISLTLIALFVLSSSVKAEHEDDPHSQNFHRMGHDVDPASLTIPGANPDIHSDIAFWGNYAFQGNYDGFRILDVSAPGNPKLVSRTFCILRKGIICDSCESDFAV